MKKFRIRKTCNDNLWVVANGSEHPYTSSYLNKDGTVINHCCAFKTKVSALYALDLYLKKQQSTTLTLAENPEYYGQLASEKQRPQTVHSHTFVRHPDRKLEVKDTNPKDALGIKKAPLSTLPTGPMYEVALAMLEGARKYGRHNYRIMGVKASVYYDAAMGHLTAWWEGEDLDPVSGLHHLAKAMACLAVVRDSMMMENWIDDRPPRYPNSINLMRNNPAVAIILKKYPDCVDPFTEKTQITETTPGHSGDVQEV